MAEEKNTQTAQEAPALAEMDSGTTSPTAADRRESAEWDASKVPPSRFQKRKGSIYSTPGSRDGHVDSNFQTKFHEKHQEKGYHRTK